MQVQFDLPTLVTLTAPTCAGKNYLLEALIERLGFERIVSTTTRLPRAGEVEGLHYNFISLSESKRLERDEELAELVTYNGTRYGVTHVEMENKMRTGRPPIVILEPSGLEIYKKYCASKGWQLFNIFVTTPESVRLERLIGRTTDDVLQAVNDAQRLHALATVRPLISKIITTNNKRIQAVLEQERSWMHAARWDVLADGTDVEVALTDVIQAVAFRNSRSKIYA